MISALVLATLLTISDPSNDAVGSGTLVPPSSQEFVAGSLDITEFSLLDADDLTVELKFASLANPFDRVLGFSFPIIEIYIQDNDQSTGATSSLEGSGMFFPKGSFWTYALRLTGDKAEVFSWTSEGLKSIEPVSVFSQDNTLTIRTRIQTPKALTAYGIAGYYTPFSSTGWQSISLTPAPWAYSSTNQQSPIVEVISADPQAQVQAINNKVMTAIASSSPPNYWMYVMIAGLALAILGFLVRLRTRAPQAETTPEKEPPSTVPERSPESVAAFEAFLKMPNSPESQMDALANHEADTKETSPENEDGETEDAEEVFQLLTESRDPDFEPDSDSAETELFSDDAVSPAHSDFEVTKLEEAEVNSPDDRKESVEVKSIGEFPDNDTWDDETDSVWEKPKD